jgi:hypothetical protein
MNNEDLLKTIWFIVFSFVIICLTLILFISPVSAGYNITSNVTNTKISYYLDTPLKTNDSAYFNGELLDYPIDDEIVISGLDSGREYELRIYENETGNIYTHYTSTLGFNFSESFAEYAVLGILFLSLIVCLFVPYSGIVIVLLAFFNVISAARAGEHDGVIIGIYILIIISAMSIEIARDEIREKINLR